jgi:hypothetical protein
VDGEKMNLRSLSQLATKLSKGAFGLPNVDFIFIQDFFQRLEAPFPFVVALEVLLRFITCA